MISPDKYNEGDGWLTDRIAEFYAGIGPMDRYQERCWAHAGHCKFGANLRKPEPDPDVECPGLGSLSGHACNARGEARYIGLCPDCYSELIERR